ncbi:4-hydroxyproline epimerase [soil metagenome]
MAAAAHPPTRIIDSHTGGEPTRVIVSGGPALGAGPMAERLQRFRGEHDHWRRALVTEPRGSEVMVGALVCEPTAPDQNACGVIFFNNVGYLGMCGHGTIGLVQTLLHLGRLEPGPLRIETPVGVVSATLHEDGSVTVANVPAYRHARRVALQVRGHGELLGDVAWGGNWFFLCDNHGLALARDNIAALAALAEAIRSALQAQQVFGADGAEIDHIELLGPPRLAGNQGRSFVMCPGGAYDRSPCGTGTSAKLACLAADRKLEPGELWRQESVIDSVFTGHYEWPDDLDGAVLPFIRGRAHIVLDATLVIDPADPFAWGL